MPKDRRSRDQKRKAKLAKRARKPLTIEPEPYEGTKYQSPRWTPYVSRTELAIYEGIQASERKLTNKQVKEALDQLIVGLQGNLRATLSEDEPEVAFEPGREVEFLKWNIRRHWGILFEEQDPVGTRDLIGILRTLLYSLKAHAWNTGPARGYVDFLEGFMKRGGGLF